MFILITNALILVLVLWIILNVHYQFHYNFLNLSITNYDIFLIAFSQFFLSAFVIIRKSKKPLFILYFNECVIVIVCSILLAILDLFYNFNWILYFTQFFNYFQLKGSLQETINGLVAGNGIQDFAIFIPIVTILSILIVYFSIFSYLREKTIYVFEGNETQSKYITFGYSLMNLLTNLLPFFALYLLLVRNDLFQAVIIIDAFVFTRFCFIALINRYMEILTNYSDLLQLFQKPEPIDEDRQLFDILRYSFKFGGLSIIFFLTFIFTFLAILDGFNIISLIYVLLCLIVWYHIFTEYNC